MTPTELNEARMRISVMLKTRRLKLNVTQRALSKACGLTTRTIGRIESGRLSWDVDSQIIYEEALQKLIVL